MRSFIKIFSIIYLPFLIVSIFVFYFTNTIMVESVTKELLEQMKVKWMILNTLPFNKEFDSKLHGKLKSISKETDLRVTWAEPSGKVIDDSYFDLKTIYEMDNHLLRPEFREALRTGDGHTLRYSSTTNMEMIYFVKKRINGYFLRVAYPATHISKLKHEFFREHLTLFLLLFLVSGIIAAYLARKISAPVRIIESVAGDFELGAKQIALPTFPDPYMAKVAERINRIYKNAVEEQERLLMERNILDRIFGNLKEGIIMLDKDNRIVHSNGMAEKLLGVTLVNGKILPSWIDDSFSRQFFDLVFDSSETKVRQEFESENRIIQWELQKLPDEKIIIFSDVTEEARYDRYKSQLIENISHELRTPLTMVMGFAETILNDPEISEESLQLFLQKIYNHSHRINAVLQDILELHKLESLSNGVTVDTPSNLQEILDDLELRYSKHPQKTLYCEAEPDKVSVHYEHIFSVLSNLIENAIKYSEGDAVYVRILKALGGITIQVEDEGPVIPMGKRTRIFERFYTISHSRSRSSAGTGLGLPIVKHISQLYNGSITLTEGKTGGNLFTVHLFERAH